MRGLDGRHDPDELQGPSSGGDSSPEGLPTSRTCSWAGDTNHQRRRERLRAHVRWISEAQALLGAYGAILWKASEWKVIAAMSECVIDLTVNEAEYYGFILACELATRHGLKDPIICGDSRLVIQQEEIECKAPGLKLLMIRAKRAVSRVGEARLVHVKREYNAAADLITGRALQRGSGEVVDADQFADLQTLSKLPEVLMKNPKAEEASAIDLQAVATRSSARRGHREAADLLEIQGIRAERIGRAQNEEKWIADLKMFLKGDLGSITDKDAAACRKIADQYEIDSGGLLYFVGQHYRKDPDGDITQFRLVVPTTLQREILHFYHTSVSGGHQGISRTYARIKTHFHWRGIHRSVQEYVGSCPDCETGKGVPRIRGGSPGNIQATRPFQVIGMDHISSLPKSHRGNTELLIWIDQHSGYVVVSADPNREAQTIAEAYEKCIYRRFGASEIIRPDREPGFMSEVFRAFGRLIGQ